MAAPARFTEQQVIMVTPELKAAIQAASEELQTSDGEVVRTWLESGMAHDLAAFAPERQAKAAQLAASRPWRGSRSGKA